MPLEVQSELALLRKEFMAQDVAKLLNDYLIFATNSLPAFAANAQSIRYNQDLYSDDSDPLKLDPALLASSAEFPTVKISSITEKFAGMVRYGFAVEFDENVRRYTDKLDEVVRARDRIARWLAVYRNTLATNAVVQSKWGATATVSDDSTNGPRVFSASVPWTASTASPVNDVIDGIQRLEAQSGYAYRLTDIWMPSLAYYSFVKYIVGTMASTANWQQTPFQPNLVVPAIGNVKFHLVNQPPSGTFTDSQGQIGLGMDMSPGHVAVTRYFSDAQVEPFTRAGDGLYAHQYVNDKNHKLVYQFWFEETYVNREPLGVILFQNLT